MASGRQNLSTYVAKRLIGDSQNVNWAGALLHSGTGGKTSSMDTWIFADDCGSASSTYGFLHRQSDDKLVFVGASVDRFWNDLNSGDTYVAGKLGIGYNPETSGNTYKLYVNGTSLYTGRLYGNTGNGLEVQSLNSGNWKEGIRIYNASDNYSVLCLCNNDLSDLLSLVHSGSAHSYYIDIENEGTYSKINIPSKHSGTMALTDGYGASGTWGINVTGSAGSVAWNNVSSKPANYPGGCTGNAATATKLKTARNLWGNSFDGSAAVDGTITLGDEKPVIAKITRKKAGGGGWAFTPLQVKDNAGTDFAHFGVYGVNNALTYIFIGANGYDSTANLRIDGSGNLTAPKFTGAVVGDVTGNCSGSAGSVAWNGVSSKPATATRWPSWSEVTSKPATATRWPSWSEVTSKPSTFSPSAHTDHTSIELRPGSTSAGHGGFIDFHFNNSSADYTSRIIEWSSGTLTVYTNLNATKIYNAVWNDFAEYRESDIYEGGRVLVSNGSGKLVLSTERLQPTAHVISDTFGCSVGQSDSAKTPIGVAGRVLAYTYQDRNNYKVGDAVCAAPNGTIDIMTREEIIQYPDRIIGIVDEIPNYEIWHQVSTQYDGNGNYGGHHEAEVEVKNRIWIYVR